MTKGPYDLVVQQQLPFRGQSSYALCWALEEVVHQCPNG